MARGRELKVGDLFSFALPKKERIFARVEAFMSDGGASATDDASR